MVVVVVVVMGGWALNKGEGWDTPYLSVRVSAMLDEGLDNGQAVDHAPIVARFAVLQDSAMESCVTCTRRDVNEGVSLD